MTSPSLKTTASPRWTREQIRQARRAELTPLLQAWGLQLVAEEAGNFTLPAFPGLILKENYWRWPERNLAGNTIDFFVQVLNLPGHAPHHGELNAADLRWQPGRAAPINSKIEGLRCQVGQPLPSN